MRMMADANGAGADREARGLNARAAERHFVGGGKFLVDCGQCGEAPRQGVRSEGCGGDAAGGVMQERAAAHRVSGKRASYIQIDAARDGPVIQASYFSFANSPICMVRQRS